MGAEEVAMKNHITKPHGDLKEKLKEWANEKKLRMTSGEKVDKTMLAARKAGVKAAVKTTVNNVWNVGNEHSKVLEIENEKFEDWVRSDKEKINSDILELIYKIKIPFIFWVYCNSCITQHGLRSSCSYRDKI